MKRRGSPSRPTAILALSLLGVLLAGAGLRASPTEPAPETGAAEPAFRVLDPSTLWLGPAELAEAGTATAVEGRFPRTLAVQGTITVVENRVEVVPCRVNAGRVDQVFKVTGDTVHAGDPLALIYSPDYVAAREEYLQITRGQRATRDGLDRGDGALDGLAEDARRRLENMGLRRADIAGLARAGNHLVVRAPRSGVLLSVNTMAGNLQNLGDTLFTVADLARVWFVGDLYLQDLPKVHVGQAVSIWAEDLARPLHGTLSFISPVVDPTVHTVKARVLVANPDFVLKPDMYARGEILLADPRALLVPADAVLRTRGKAFCFLALGGGRFREKVVRTGRESAGAVAIRAGLNAGDEVLASEVATFDQVLDRSRSPE